MKLVGQLNRSLDQ
jgi:hypothetical protein